MTFFFDSCVAPLRAAAAEPDPNSAVVACLRGFLADRDSLIDATPEEGEDEVQLFEDDSLSIWRCRFHPDVIVPPHEHRMVAHIAAYGGGEKSILFRRGEGRLEHVGTKVARAGDVLSLDEDAIHAVRAEGNCPSLAIHVYMGPLMAIKRGLFDWETGTEIDFSMENFGKLTRPASALPNY